MTMTEREFIQGERMTSNKIPLWLKVLASVYTYARLLYENPVFTGWLLGISTMLAIIEFE